MRIKKILSFALLISLLVNAIPVLAKEGYYTNRNGLELTFDEYRLALEHIDECTLEVINREQYEYILSHSSCVQKENIYIKTIIDRKDGDVISEHLLSEEEIIDELNCQNISLAQCGGRVASTYGYREEKRYDTVDTEMKHLELAMTSVGASSKTVTLTCEWLSIPKYKSYDVLGFWTNSRAVTFNNMSSSHICGYQYYNDENPIKYSGDSGNIKKCEKGIGISMNIADEARHSLKLQFTVLFGTAADPFGVAGSYQHCQKDISLFASQRYDIQASGMGGVFQFNPSVGKYYDNTPGLMVVGSIN